MTGGEGRNLLSTIALLLMLMQIAQLNALIMLLIGKLSSGDRQKIMTICTIEVHNRDVVGKLIAQKVCNNSQSINASLKI